MNSVIVDADEIDRRVESAKSRRHKEVKRSAIEATKDFAKARQVAFLP